MSPGVASVKVWTEPNQWISCVECKLFCCRVICARLSGNVDFLELETFVNNSLPPSIPPGKLQHRGKGRKQKPNEEPTLKSQWQKLTRIYISVSRKRLGAYLKLVGVGFSLRNYAHVHCNFSFLKFFYYMYEGLYIYTAWQLYSFWGMVRI